MGGRGEGKCGAEGVRTWKPLLRPGGTLVVSELTWTTANRPGEIEAHWTAEYPGITAPSANMRTLEDAGYAPIGFFFIPASSWLAHYYAPLEAGADAFLERHDHRDAARAIVESDRAEARLAEACARLTCNALTRPPVRWPPPVRNPRDVVPLLPRDRYGSRPVSPQIQTRLSPLHFHLYRRQRSPDQDRSLSFSGS